MKLMREMIQLNFSFIAMKKIILTNIQYRLFWLNALL